MIILSAMSAPYFAWFNGVEIVAILVVVLVLFGAKKLPELAKGLGQGIKEFKKATREVTDEINRAGEEEPPSYSPNRRLPESTVPSTSGTPPADSVSAPQPPAPGQKA